MSVAQRLYEGVETPDGHVGLITYMRTDSTAIAGVAMGEAREVIGERYGEAYTMPKGRVYKTKAKGAQEAHESDPPDELPARPGLDGRVPEVRRGAPLPAHLAARARVADGAQGAGDHDDRAGGWSLRAARVGDQGPVRRLRDRVHRRSRRRGRGRRGRGGRPAAGAGRGGRHHRRRRHADPALHRSRRRGSRRRP